MKINRENLIGKRVIITDKSSWAYEEWGVVKFFDGEYFHIALYNDENSQLIFERRDFKVTRNS